MRVLPPGGQFDNYCRDKPAAFKQERGLHNMGGGGDLLIVTGHKYALPRNCLHFVTRNFPRNLIGYTAHHQGTVDELQC